MKIHVLYDGKNIQLKDKKVNKFILLAIFFSFTTNASIIDDLNQDDLAKLDKGENIVKTTEIKGLVWPEITIYQKIEATSLEAVAIFYALDYQKEYIPNLIKSDVVKEETPTKVFASYELKMPWPISNSKYTHGHELTYQADHSSYKVRWWMVESTSTEKVEGSATFETYNQQAIMKYQALVVPKSFFASFVKSRMLEDVEKSLNATREAIKRAKKENKEILHKYISFIENALKGKFSYTNEQN